MKKRLTRIYTRTGDQGSTGLADGSRVSKADIRIECIGAVDALNSSIGVVIAHCESNHINAWLTNIQNRLFDLGGELAIPGSKVMDNRHVEWLENCLDEMNEALPPLEEFILPGGHKAAAFTHLARTECRKTEQHLFKLANDVFVNPDSLAYINRLSDFLFVAARTLNKIADVPEPVWQR